MTDRNQMSSAPKPSSDSQKDASEAEPTPKPTSSPPIDLDSITIAELQKINDDRKAKLAALEARYKALVNHSTKEHREALQEWLKWRGFRAVLEYADTQIKKDAVLTTGSKGVDDVLKETIDLRDQMINTFEPATSRIEAMVNKLNNLPPVEKGDDGDE